MLSQIVHLLKGPVESMNKPLRAMSEWHMFSMTELSIGGVLYILEIKTESLYLYGRFLK